MPKLIMYYSSAYNGVADERFHELGNALRPLVANAASTDSVPLNEDDVDWLPQPYGRGARFSQDIAFEIETFGFPERKAKLTEKVVQKLKSDFVTATSPYLSVDGNKQLIWIRYIDPDGFHI